MTSENESGSDNELEIIINVLMNMILMNMIRVLVAVV